MVLVRTNLCVPKREDKRTGCLNFNVTVNINVDLGASYKQVPRYDTNLLIKALCNGLNKYRNILTIIEVL